MNGRRPVNPAGLAAPKGFAHGVLVEGGGRRTLYLAGQCGHDREGRIASPGDLVAQLDRALDNVRLVLDAAGMSFADLVQLNLYVVSRDDYTVARSELGRVWREYGGRHYPAMALLEVGSLYDPDALIEVQGIAEAEPS